MSDEPASCATCAGRLGLTAASRVCDGAADCPDMEDETPAACSCPHTSWRCDAGLVSNTSSPGTGEEVTGQWTVLHDSMVTSVSRPVHPPGLAV